MNPLTGLFNLQKYVDTPEELNKLTDKIILRNTPPVSGKQWKDVVEGYCKFTDNKNFLKVEKNIWFLLLYIRR
jgi:hypothetical protein